MRARNDVYLLIKSLNKSEKGLFVKHAKTFSGKQLEYLKLFRALEQTSDYEEESFLKSEAGKGFVRNFHVRKRELFEKILLVLRSQRQIGGHEKHIEFRLRERMEDVRILQEKSLKEISNRRLEQTVRKVEQHDLHEIMLELLRMEREFLLNERVPDIQPKLKVVSENMMVVSETIYNKNRLLKLRDQLFWMHRNHLELKGQVDIEVLNQIMSSPELNNIALCISFEARSNFHFCHALYNLLIRQASEAWIHFRAVYLMWQEQKGLQRLKPVEFRNMIQNYLSISNQVLRYQDFDKALGQLLQGKFSSQAERATAKQSALHIQLQRQINECKWTEARQTFQRFKDGLPTFSEYLSSARMMSFYLSFARLFAISDNWPKGLKYALMVVEEGKKNFSNGLVLQAWMLKLIKHFEFQELEELSKAERQLQEGLQRLGWTEGAEAQLARILEKYVLERQGAEFRQQLSDWMLQYDGPTLFEFGCDIILIAWAKAQLEGSSLAEEMTKEYKKALAKANEAARPPAIGRVEDKASETGKPA